MSLLIIVLFGNIGSLPYIAKLHPLCSVVPDSCFALIGAHQCGVLMDVLGRLAAYVSTPSTKLVASTQVDS